MIIQIQSLLTCLFLSVITTSYAIIPLSSSLHASNLTQTWSSPNKTFFLGFTRVGPNAFDASIYYTGGEPVIWAAGTVDAGGSLQFLPNGNLQLVNSSGIAAWDSNTTNRGVTSASLEDSGDLRLFRNDSVSVWSSFQNPTDTVVPSQYFTSNHTLRSGTYSFRFLNSANLSLIYSDSTAYWNKDLTTISSGLTPPLRLQLQSNGILSVSDANLTSSVAFSNDYGEGSDILRFLRLDSDGNLRMYSTSRVSGTTTTSWTALADQCQVYGYCGNFGICIYNDTSPVCECPSENFEPIDADDARKGCKRKVELQECAEIVTMFEMNDTKFLTFQDSQVVTLAITACQSNCLKSQSCIAASSLSDGSGLCYLKNTLDFVSGYHRPAVLSTSYVKVCAPVQPNPSDSVVADENGNCGRLKPWTYAVIAFLILVLVFITLAGGFGWYKTSRKHGVRWAQYTPVEYASGSPIQFSYKELQGATKGFKEKLGAGGFGAVYRGILGDSMVVAVKQLEGIEQGEKQFRIEVATISSTHHLNLVKLIGFCSEGRHRLLVYDFMKNGSLDKFLFDTEEQSGRQLNWERRFRIAIGTAKGITYLHEECRDCIVHCDIKPENILLDENYIAKVSDFGLAKLINRKDQRHLSMRSIRGTRGYLAPEWLASLPIASKSDVYSFGMVLLEIVSGTRNFEVSQGTNNKKFSIWAYEEFDKGNAQGLLDKRISDEDVDMEQVKRAIQVSFWCVQEHPSQRPTMAKVVQMLEGIIEIEKPPAITAVFADETTGGGSINTSSSSENNPNSTFEVSAPATYFHSPPQTVGLLASEITPDGPSSSLL